MKKFLTEGLLFLLIFIVVDYFSNLSNLRTSFPELDQLNVALQDDTDIILFGSSVNKFSAKDDTNKQSIDEMLDIELATQKVVGISSPAYHAELFHTFLRHLSKKEKKLKLIIPINLRSFSPIWDMNPYFQFVSEQNIIDYYGLSYVPFSKNKPVEESDYLKAPVFEGKTQVGTIEEFKNPIRGKDMIRQGFTFYMHPIDTLHRKLIALQQIGALANKHAHIEVFYYITPIDYERAMKLNIPNFDELIQTNLSVIKEGLSMYTEDILDLSISFPQKDFCYYFFPNEHLDMNGRSKVAKALAKFLMEQ